MEIFCKYLFCFLCLCFQTGPPQQPRSTGALYRETLQVHGNGCSSSKTKTKILSSTDRLGSILSSCLPQTCTSAFATRDRLRAHLIRHEEKVPCHICGKLLSAAYITDHMRVHNQSQHHACHLCNRSESHIMRFNQNFLKLSKGFNRKSDRLSAPPQASPPSPTCESTLRSTTVRNGRRVAGHGGALAGQEPAGCCYVSCVGCSARRPHSSRATWAPTPTKGTPALTRQVRVQWAPPAWLSLCPVRAQWDCW